MGGTTKPDWGPDGVDRQFVTQSENDTEAIEQATNHVRQDNGWDALVETRRGRHLQGV